jgi:hypothetical protein
MSLHGLVDRPSVVQQSLAFGHIRLGWILTFAYNDGRCDGGD